MSTPAFSRFPQKPTAHDSLFKSDPILLRLQQANHSTSSSPTSSLVLPGQNIDIGDINMSVVDLPMLSVTEFFDICDKPWLAGGTYPKSGFKKKHRETKTMTFIGKKKIIGFMVLLCFIASIASAEARAYPAAGSQNQSANATTFFAKTKGEDDPKLLHMCGYPCCGIKYRGPCIKCCSKGKPHAPGSPLDDTEEAGNAGGDKH